MAPVGHRRTPLRRARRVPAASLQAQEGGRAWRSCFGPSRRTPPYVWGACVCTHQLLCCSSFLARWWDYFCLVTARLVGMREGEVGVEGCGCSMCIFVSHITRSFNEESLSRCAVARPRTSCLPLEAQSPAHICEPHTPGSDGSSGAAGMEIG